MAIKKVVSGLIVLLFGMLAVPVFAQPPQPIKHLILQLENDQFKVYSTDDSGQFSFLGLWDDFWLSRDDPRAIMGQWQINLPSHVVLSPDGTRIAFTAHNGTEAALFIVTPGQTDIVYVPIPGLASLSWLPDNAGILLYPVKIHTGHRDIEVREIYLYNLTSGKLTMLTDNPEGWLKYSVTWISEIGQVLYTEPYIHCEAPCLITGDFYLTSLEGEVTRLTDLGSQIPSDIPDHSYGYCAASKPTWSPVNQRLYYVAQCSYPGGDLPYDLLYSVSPSGDNRLEANTPAIFPDDFSITIEGIHPTANGDVYVVTGSYNYDIPGNFSELWRVLRITGPNQWEIIVDPGEALPYPAVTAISPDETRIAISSQWENGYLVIVDLDDGQFNQLPTSLPQSICEMQWLDSQRILGVEYGNGCYTYRAPGAAHMFNIDTGEDNEITAPLGGRVWFLIDGGR